MSHRARRIIVNLIFAAWLTGATGCGPSAAERQADALVAKATELSLAGGSFKARHEAHAQADRIYREVIANYSGTPAAKAAQKGLERMVEIHAADKAVAAEELQEVYRQSIDSVMQAAGSKR